MYPFCLLCLLLGNGGWQHCSHLIIMRGQAHRKDSKEADPDTWSLQRLPSNFLNRGDTESCIYFNHYR